jgi:hypothetical protein
VAAPLSVLLSVVVVVLLQSEDVVVLLQSEWQMHCHGLLLLL